MKTKNRKSSFAAARLRTAAAIKKNPQALPLLALCIAFLQFSLNLSSISNTTARIQGQNMGLSAFISMLFMLLSFVCMLNAYPKRQKPKYAMVILMEVLYGAVIFADLHYLGRIEYALTREISPIVVNADTQFILEAQSALQISVVLVAITAVCVLIEPLYAKLLKKIKLTAELDGQNIEAIDISDED